MGFFSDTISGEPPNGVVLQGDELHAIERYITDRYNQIQNLAGEIQELVAQAASLQAMAADTGRRKTSVASRIIETDTSLRSAVDNLIRPALEKAETIEKDIRAFADSEVAKSIQAREDILNGLTPNDIVDDHTGGKMGILEKALNAQITTFEEESRPRIAQVVDDLLHLTDQSSITVLAASQGKEIQALQERLAYLVEIAQIGLIVETANHEYENQVDAIRVALKKLKLDAVDTQLKYVQSLSDAFEIVDQRIRLIDPLIRRQTPTGPILTGLEIEDFLHRRFFEYFKAGEILVTESFRAIKWNDVKRAVFLGAVHNIVHNAIYWSSQGRKNKRVQLSGTDLFIVISDNGPGIRDADRARIFNPGFSRRPYGRGLGLFIARESLRGIGYELYSPEHPELGALEGANFVIIPKSNLPADDND